MQGSKNIAMALIALIAVSIPAAAQSGALLGTVSDESGALIPGVAITVTNEETNQTRTAVTNETGNYRVEPLTPGRYSISAELSGFRKEVRSGIVVNVDARARMDFTLVVGQVSEVVEVSAEAPVVQTDDSQVGTVMDQRKIVELPLNGRNFSALAYLTPGAFAPRSGSHLSDRGGFVAAGLEEKTNQLIVDGINNNGSGTMEAAYRVNIDTVAEFKIQTQNYNAQYGRFAGAQVDAITKSGTNEIHGTIFGFTRNDNLDARNYFDPGTSTKPEFKRHQYGGTIGGPIIKDKAFFFAGFQGQRQTFFRSTNPTVPQPEFWSGNLARLNRTIRDPQTNQPFPNGVIPANRLDPTALKFRPYFFVEPTSTALTRNANALLAEPEHFWQPDAKISWALSPNHQLTGSWGLYDSDLLEWRIANSPELPNYMMYGEIANQRFSIQEVWSITPTVINEFRGGISRVHRVRLPFLRDRNYAREVFGISGTVGDVDPIGYGIPDVQITGYSSLNRAGTQPRVDGNWMLSDTLSIQKGNHALKFGGDVFRQYMNLVVLSAQSGTFQFTGQYSGDPFADFLLGLPAVTQRAFPLGPISMHPRRWSTNWFFQDDWKASRNLTINYGLRWEGTMPLDEKWGRLSTFDPALSGGRGGIRLINGDRYADAVKRFREIYPTVEVKENGGSLHDSDWNNFAPRVGFAWTPFGGSNAVIRGGWGVFFTIDDLCLCGHYNLSPFMLTQRFGPTDAKTFSSPFPTATAGAISVEGITKDFDSARYQHWNLGIQYQLPYNIGLDVSYVGKNGNSIDSIRDLNQPINGVRPYPLFGVINWNESVGNSIYHGLQTRVERRSSTGGTILVSYAWSKLIDDLGTIGGFRDSYNRALERGLGQEDARHRFSASYVYAIPLGQGRQFMSNLSGVGNAILGGWEVSGIVRANSGSPLTPTWPTNNSGNGRNADRPNLIGNPRLDNPDPRTGWWNRAAFAAPAPGTVGNAGKGILIGPGYLATDFSLLKRFRISENQDLQFRAEIFNALNQPNFFNPVTVFAGAFGTIGATAADNRQIQLGLKYMF